ncbi:DUF2079 domain-containing protein [Pleurocapsales cyanobacterium LEGE 10410]|nr:DUF2079 domain-containing protein [Pleurocapsales cyanobacterium LEGE 10410]
MLSKLSIDSEKKVVVVSAIAFLICTLLLTLHRHFTFYSSYDQGIFNQVFWNGIHGNFFQSTLSSQLSTNVIHDGQVPYVGYHRLGQHFTPALLLWLPIYYLFPHPATLTVLQAVLVTAAGIVLYALARVYLEPAIAALITVSFYCANAVVGPTLGNFHDISQIPLFVFGLLLAMEKRCWWLFAILGICVLAVREDSGITLFGIGVYLILSRRYPRLGLAVCLGSLLYVLTVTNLIMPIFSNDISKRFMLENFGQYAEGDQASTLEIIVNMITNPWRLLVEMLTPWFGTLKYSLGQWLPLAYVPVVAPAAWAIAIFPLSKLFLSQGDLVLNISIRYALSVTPGLFYGSILWWAGQGFGNFSKSIAKCRPRKLRPKFRRFWTFCICLTIFFTITSNPSDTLYFLVPTSIRPWVQVSAPEQWQHAQKIQNLLAKIPADASVSGTTWIIPHLSSRREVIRLPGFTVKNDRQEVHQVDYAIADLWHLERYQAIFTAYRDSIRVLAQLMTQAFEEGDYGIIGFDEGVVLLQKDANSAPAALKNWRAYLEKI